MSHPLAWTLALAATAVAGLWTMLGDDGGPRAEHASPRAASFGTLDFYGAGSSALVSKEEEPEPETTSPEVAAQPVDNLVPVTLHVQYTNGYRPRGILLAHEYDGRKAKAISARNPGHSGVFRVHLKPGSHRVSWFFDRVALHVDDPIPLEIPEWTIDTGNTSTWDLTLPVAALVVVRDPSRGLPELWLDGARVKPEWDDWDTYRQGPRYLTTCHGTSSKVARVEPGIYTIHRGMGAERWCRTIALNAGEPFVLDQDS